MQAYRILGRAFYILPQFTEERLAELAPALVAGAEGCGVRYYRALLFERLEMLDGSMSDLRLILNDPDVSQWTKCLAQNRLDTIERKIKAINHGSPK